jgi:hypothetical protein
LLIISPFKLEPDGKHSPSLYSWLRRNHNTDIAKIGCKCIGFHNGRLSIFTASKANRRSSFVFPTILINHNGSQPMIGKIIRTRFFKKTVTPGIDLKVLIPCVPGSSIYVTIQYPSDRDQYQHKYYSYGNYSLFHCVDNRCIISDCVKKSPCL